MALSSSSPGLGKLSHLPIYPSFPTVAHKCLKPVHVASVKGGDSGDGIALPPLNAPVYSLATHDADGRQHTLNIVTYTSPVSIRPKYYALGLYRGTLSWENMLETGEAALQVCVKANQH